MSSDIVMVANKSYIIKQSMSDRIRRRKYFMTFNGASVSSSLTEDEQRLLDDLGIDSKMILSLKFYLSTFFENLHMCSSDTSLILRKDCNIPYYVLWSIMFANKKATDERIRANKEAHLVSRNIDVAMTGAMLHNMEGKELSDPVDKLFQLILTTPAEVEVQNNSLFRLPSNLTAETDMAKNATADVQNTDMEMDMNMNMSHNREFSRQHIDESGLINQLFTLIRTDNQKKLENERFYNGVSSSELAKKLQLLLAKRTSQPLYTFSQHETTCTTDTLFTLLLQADGLRDILLPNAYRILQGESDGPYGPLSLALRRYINMLEVEVSHVATKDESTKRRYSVNKTKQFGKEVLAALQTMDGNVCVGATRSAILNYLTTLKAQLIRDGLLPDPNMFDFFAGTQFKTKLRDASMNIQGIYVTHPGNSAEGEPALGHATGFVKINDAWYFADNEIGLLHEIHDPVLIPFLLYTLARSTNDSDTLFEMKHVRAGKDHRTDLNLRYQFIFHLDGSGDTYSYPENNPEMFQGVDSGYIYSPHVTPLRIILLATNDDSKHTVLDKAIRFTDSSLTDAEFLASLRSDTPVNQSKAILNELDAMKL